MTKEQFNPYDLFDLIEEAESVVAAKMERDFLKAHADVEREMNGEGCGCNSCLHKVTDKINSIIYSLSCGDYDTGNWRYYINYAKGKGKIERKNVRSIPRDEWAQYYYFPTKEEIEAYHTPRKKRGE